MDNIIRKERFGHSSALIRDKVYIFGGVTATGDNNDNNNAQAVEYTNSNDLIEATIPVTLQEKEQNSFMREFNDTDAATCWTIHTKATNAPSPRSFHSCVVYQDRMYIFGGKSNGYLNDLHMYDPMLNTWTELTYNNETSKAIPSGRYGHSACVMDGKMMIFGGYDSDGYSCNDLKALDLSTLKWTSIELHGEVIPKERYLHSMSGCEHCLFIYGGLNEHGKCLNDLHVIDTQTGKCYAMYQSENGRYGHMSFCYKEGGYFILNIIGGCSETRNLYNDSFIFNVESSFQTVSVTSTHGRYKLYNKATNTAPCDPVFCSVSVISSDCLIFFGGTRKYAGDAPPASSKQIEIEPRLQQLIHTMPDDVSLVILSYLNRYDLCVIANVSKNWRFCQLSEHNMLWEPIFNQRVLIHYYAPVREEVLSDTSTDSYKRKLLILRDLYNQYLKRKLDAEKEELWNQSLPSDQMGNLHEYIGLDQLKGKFKGITTKGQLKRKFGIDGVYLPYYNSTTNKTELQPSIKAIAVGDGGTGKTGLLVRVTSNSYPEDYYPTVFDTNASYVNLYGSNYAVSLWDSIGCEDYDRLRPLSYPHTNVFLLCFSVVYPSSMISIQAKWIPEVMHHCPSAAMILVGTKVDLREHPDVLRTMKNKGIEPIREEEGIKLAQLQKCALYLETSALTGKNLSGHEFMELLFQTCIHYQSIQSKKYRGKCILH